MVFVFGWLFFLSHFASFLSRQFRSKQIAGILPTVLFFKPLPVLSSLHLLVAVYTHVQLNRDFSVAGKHTSKLIFMLCEMRILILRRKQHP